MSDPINLGTEVELIQRSLPLLVFAIRFFLLALHFLHPVAQSGGGERSRSPDDRIFPYI
jgi:hypothetical protein